MHVCVISLSIPYRFDGKMSENQTTRKLIRMGGSLLISIPNAFVKQHGLEAGDSVLVLCGSTALMITAGGKQ